MTATPEPADMLDVLAFAREQLSAITTNLHQTPSPPTELRLQAGLLAAQIAIAERLPPLPSPNPAPGPAASAPAGGGSGAAADSPAPVESVEAGGSTTTWTVALITRILARATPSAIEMIEAIAAEGGRISPARLLEVTGRRSYAGMSQAVRIATREADPPENFRTLVCRKTSPARELYFPPGTLPLVTASLQRFRPGDQAQPPGPDGAKGVTL